jgi:hypothetical protein
MTPFHVIVINPDTMTYEECYVIAETWSDMYEQIMIKYNSKVFPWSYPDNSTKHHYFSTRAYPDRGIYTKEEKHAK